MTPDHGGRSRIGRLLFLVALATALRLAWTLTVPTIPVGDFATYRESAIYLAEFGSLDPGFVYMPGFVALLAILHLLGGDLMAAKLLGALFGGLAAGAVYLVAWHLSDNGEGARPGQDGPARAPGREAAGAEDQPRPGPSAGPGVIAFVAGLGYAIWPAGIAMSSVIGTDIPAAALILSALALLSVWGPTRPMLASVAFGVGMGVAAYFRAVALPLTVLSALYWLARQAGLRAIVGRTAIAIAVTVLVLSPWGLRNRRQGGEFHLTDSHGGITALMGSDPNTEGTYSRSLFTTFRQLTGRTFLMQPHQETDRVAYGLARQFMTFDPAWTAGMIALRLQRLFAPERGLLYWPVYRAGVVPPATAAWFHQHRPAITALVDWFYLLLLLCLCAGMGFAVAERRWLILVPLPFAMALAATYALFVAEPRYRVTTEALCFPVVGFGAARLAGGFRQIFSAWRRAAGGGRVPRDTRRGLSATLVTIVLLVAVAGAVVEGGKVLRDRHRFAATVWQVDGRSQLALWRASRTAGEGGASPVRGSSPGAAVRLDGGQQQVRAEIVLPGVAPAPTASLTASLDWRGAGSPDAITIDIGGLVVRGKMATVRGEVRPGGRESLLLTVRIERAPGQDAGPPLEVVFSDASLTTGAVR